MLNYDQGTPLPRLAPGIPTTSPLLLPRSWILLLRVLLQRGVAEATFKQLAALASTSQPSAAGVEPQGLCNKNSVIKLGVSYARCALLL